MHSGAQWDFPNPCGSEMESIAYDLFAQPAVAVEHWSRLPLKLAISIL